VVSPSVKQGEKRKAGEKQGGARRFFAVVAPGLDQTHSTLPQRRFTY